MNWFSQIWGGGSARSSSSGIDSTAEKREDDNTMQDMKEIISSLNVESEALSPTQDTETTAGASSVESFFNILVSSTEGTSSTSASAPIEVQKGKFAFEHGTLFLIDKRIPTKYLSNVTAVWTTPTTLKLQGHPQISEAMSPFVLDLFLLCYYRWHDPVMQEIVLEKEKRIETYGILFPTQNSASTFYKQIIETLTSKASCDLTCLVDVFRYSLDSKTFVSTAKEVEFCVYNGNQLKSCNFIIICKQKGSGILFHTFLESYSDLVFTMEKGCLELTVQENEEDFSARYAIEFKEKEDLFTFIKFTETRFGEQATHSTDDAVSFLSPEDYPSGDELEWSATDSEDEEVVNVSTRNRKKTRHRSSRNAIEGYKNRFVEVGKKYAFVFSETSTGKDTKVQMELVQVDEEGQVNSNAVISDSQFFYKSAHVNPSQALLLDEHELLLTDVNSSSVYCLDANRETIVQKWEDPTLKAISLVAPKRIGAPSSSVVFGYNDNTLFSLDKRIPSKIVGPRYAYVSSPSFSCGALDKKGHIALGSAGSGEIRLYNGEEDYKGNFKKAKTLISGLGQPLLHVAVTTKGDWILGTTRHYLVLYAISIRVGREKWNAFERPTAGKMKEPYILRVRPADLQARNLPLDLEFKKAEFDHTEVSIIAIAESVAILWNLRQVLAGNKDCYHILHLHDQITDMGILGTGTNESLIMATPYSVSATHVKTPTVQPRRSARLAEKN